MLYKEFTELALDHKISTINDILARVMASGKSPKRSKTFAADSGLGVCFSEIERHLRAYNYGFDGTKFIKMEEYETNPVSKKPVKDKRTVIMDSCPLDSKVVKKSLLMYPETFEQFEKLCKEYHFFRKVDVLNAIICEGIRSFND